MGVDVSFDEKMMKIGKRLVTKLYNAGKFVLAQQGVPGKITTELDLSFAHKLRDLVNRATKAFDAFEYTYAMEETEKFFWNNFTDTYIELVKHRARGNGQAVDPDRDSAVATLRLGLNILLRLFSPILPYITEEVWSWVFAGETGFKSIHAAPWPEESDFNGIELPENASIFDTTIACLGSIYKAKTQAGVSLAKPIEQLSLSANSKTVEQLKPAIKDIIKATRIENHAIVSDPDLEDDQFMITQMNLEE
jgi:valyl-tRNA synthetase